MTLNIEMIPFEYNSILFQKEFVANLREVSLGITNSDIDYLITSIKNLGSKLPNNEYFLHKINNLENRLYDVNSDSDDRNKQYHFFLDLSSLFSNPFISLSSNFYKLIKDLTIINRGCYNNCFSETYKTIICHIYTIICNVIFSLIKKQEDRYNLSKDYIDDLLIELNLKATKKVYLPYFYVDIDLIQYYNSIEKLFNLSEIY